MTLKHVTARIQYCTSTALHRSISVIDIVGCQSGDFERDATKAEIVRTYYLRDLSSPLYGLECVHSPFFGNPSSLNPSFQSRKRLSQKSCAFLRPRLARPSDTLPSADSVTQGPRIPLLTSSVFRLPSPTKHGANIAADESWAKLTLNIREIQHQNAHKLSFEECYRLGYQLVVSKNGTLLYNGVKDLVVENLNRLAEENILPTFPSGLEQDPMQQSHEGERLLKAVHKVWSDHADSMDKLSHILKYMVGPLPVFLPRSFLRVCSFIGPRLCEICQCPRGCRPWPRSLCKTHHSSTNKGSRHQRYPESHAHRTRRLCNQSICYQPLCGRTVTTKEWFRRQDGV